MDLSDNNGKKEITVGGIIDRIDVKDDVTRIVDYKTGTTSDSINSVSDLFEEDRKKDTDCWLQTMLYCEGYFLQHPEAAIAPSVYKIKKIPGEEQNDKLIIKETKHDEIKIEDFKVFRGEFMNGLQSTVNTIFDRNEPFIMTGDIWNKCSYCPYRKLCKR
jgi:hypothetical protein